METIQASELLAALGHESRLAIYRLLVEAGPDGVNASAIAEQVGLPAATLSFHLTHLSRVGLIHGTRDSRFIRYRAEFALMNSLIGFLTRDCCRGEPCAPVTICRPDPQTGPAR